MTLYSVYNSNLIPTDVSSVESTLGNFMGKLEHLANENKQQVVILSGMVFTLIIWVFSMLFLLIAVLFYVFFLWHYIPRQDGGLHGYCERKVNKRLKSIVTVKVNKALAREERDRLKAGLRAAKKTGEKPPMERQATLPTFLDAGNDDKLPEMPMLSRNDTMATLPPYDSRPSSLRGIELDSWDQKRPPPISRQGTTSTGFSSRAPLMDGAAPMGFERSASPAPTLPQMDLNNFPPPARPGTAMSNRSYGPGMPPSRVQTNGSVFGNGYGGGYASSPSTYSPDGLPSMPQPARSPPPMDGYGRPMPRPIDRLSGRSSPAPSIMSNRGPPSGPGYGRQPYPPRSVTNPMPPAQRFQPQRNMTAPMPPRQPEGYFNQRPETPSGRENMRPAYGYDGYDGDLESQRGSPRY